MGNQGNSWLNFHFYVLRTRSICRPQFLNTTNRRSSRKFLKSTRLNALASHDKSANEPKPELRVFVQKVRDDGDEVNGGNCRSCGTDQEVTTSGAVLVVHIRECPSNQTSVLVHQENSQRNNKSTMV